MTKLTAFSTSKSLFYNYKTFSIFNKKKIKSGIATACGGACLLQYWKVEIFFSICYASWFLTIVWLCSLIYSFSNLSSRIVFKPSTSSTLADRCNILNPFNGCVLFADTGNEIYYLFVNKKLKVLLFIFLVKFLILLESLCHQYIEPGKLAHLCSLTKLYTDGWLYKFSS